MKKMAWSLALASLGFASVAAAGELAERREYEPGSYSAQLYYRLDFGGNRGQAQSLGLRFDNERAAAAGAPSLMQARFGAHGIDRLTLSGTELRGPSVAANQVGGFFSSLTATQWVALIFTTVVLGTVAIDATEESDDEPSGTGGT